MENRAEEHRKRIHTDILVIVTTLTLQDIPFLCLRIVLIFKSGYYKSTFNLPNPIQILEHICVYSFRVISHMNIFFTCKNRYHTLAGFRSCTCGLHLNNWHQKGATVGMTKNLIFAV